MVTRLIKRWKRLFNTRRLKGKGLLVFLILFTGEVNGAAEGFGLGLKASVTILRPCIKKISGMVHTTNGVP